MIKLIAGLGNPGAQYALTRHNAGFWVVHALAHAAGGVLYPEKRVHGCAAQVQFHGVRLWLLQPQTFMNRSGLSVSAWAQFYKIRPDEILIAHDELDFPPGTVKLKQGGSSSHKGLKDITLHLSTPNYWRLRIGIGHPRHACPKNASIDVAHFVLQTPRPEEHLLIHQAIQRALACLPDIVHGNLTRAMNQLHGIASEMLSPRGDGRG